MAQLTSAALGPAPAAPPADPRTRRWTREEFYQMVDGQVEVRRDPVRDPTQPHGHTYATLTVLRPPASLALLAAPGATLAAADLLP